MQFKSIFTTLSFLFLVSFCSHLFAYQGKGFKIISEKLVQSPGFQGGFQSSDQGKKTQFYAHAIAYAYNAEGKVRDFIKIQGDHDVSFSNYTHQTQRYTYKYVLSCESAYEQFERTVEVYPNGSFHDSSHSFGTVQKDAPGTFRIKTATQVSGAESTFHDAIAYLRVNR